MYCAKQRGRSNVQCFAPGMNAGAEDQRPARERPAQRRWRCNQFELHYQPKVDIGTGDVHSAEALLRWRHPDRGLVAPGDFIPLAEEMRTDRRDRRMGHPRGLPPGAAPGSRTALRRCASPSTCRRRSSAQEAWSSTIRRRPRRRGPASRRFLEVELTESAVMSDPEESIAILEQLSTMGVLVSVDDFGTGYSSMSYLRRFPIDKLKIDRSFINEIMDRAGRRLDRARDRLARAQPAPQGRRRGRRDARRSSTFLQRARLRPVPGLSLQPAAAGHASSST